MATPGPLSKRSLTVVLAAVRSTSPTKKLPTKKPHFATLSTKQAVMTQKLPVSLTGLSLSTSTFISSWTPPTMVLSLQRRLMIRWWCWTMLLAIHHLCSSSSLKTPRLTITGLLPLQSPQRSCRWRLPSVWAQQRIWTSTAPVREIPHSDGQHYHHLTAVLQ